GEMFREWMRFCFTWNLTNIVEKAEQYNKIDKSAQKTLLQYALTMMRETIIARYSAEQLQRLKGDELEFVQNFSKVVDTDKAAQMTEEITQAHYHLETNANPKILFTDLSLLIAKIIRS